MTDWSQMSVSRDRILSDSGNWSTYLQSWMTTPPRTWDNSVQIQYRSDRQYRRCWDVVTPSWKAKMNKGEIITNDFIDVSLNWTFAPVRYFAALSYPGQPYIATYNGLAMGTSPVGEPLFGPPQNVEEALEWYAASDAGSLRDEAVTTAYSRVDVSELEMLASLGEMPETVDWFRDVLKRLIAAMAYLKKRQYLDLMKQLKSLKTGKGAYRGAKGLGGLSEDTWMEWRYAIRPLIFEVKAYLAALDTKVEEATRKTARGRVLNESHSTEYITDAPGQFIYAPNVRRETSIYRDVRAGVLYSLDPELTGWWTHLGLDAPVSAAWAITRLSFVLDWFFNIGQWIASWEPRLGLTPLSSWVVETRTIEYKGFPEPLEVPYPPYTILSRNVIDVGGYSCIVRVKSRWANPDRQILPTIKPWKGLETAKVADLVVIGRKLASQLLR